MSAKTPAELREILAAERDAARDHIHELEHCSHRLRVKLERAQATIRDLEEELLSANEQARGLEARARRAESFLDELARSGRIR